MSVNCITKLTHSDGGTAACVNILGQVQHQSPEPGPLNRTHHGNIQDKQGLCTHVWPCRLSVKWKMLSASYGCCSPLLVFMLRWRCYFQSVVRLKRKKTQPFSRRHLCPLTKTLGWPFQPISNKTVFSSSDQKKKKKSKIFSTFYLEQVPTHWVAVTQSRGGVQVHRL